MPKRQNYPNRNAYRAEVLRKLGQFTTPNKRNELKAALRALPMGNRVWLYMNRREQNPIMNAARKLLDPHGGSNILMWRGKRGSKPQPHYAHQNFVNALMSKLNYPRMERTARRIMDPHYMARAYITKINRPFANTNNRFNRNITNFRGTVRGNVGNAAKKLLEIREKAAKRTIARYVGAGRVGVHISQLRKMRASNRARGIGVSPPKSMKRSLSAPPVLTRSSYKS